MQTCERNLNDIQCPFRKFQSGSCHGHWWESNVLCSVGIAYIYHTSQANSHSLEKAPQLRNIRHPRVL